MEAKAYTDITSEQGSTFAFFFLLFEVTFRLGTSGLQSAGLADYVVFGVCVICAIGTAVASALILEPLQTEEQQGNAPTFTALYDVIDIAKDPRIWCFAFTNLTFGLSAGYMNGVVNQELAARQLGESSVGILTAVTSICAVGFTIVYGYVALSSGKGLVILLGSCSMLAIPVCTLFTEAASWGWGIALLYLMQGSGRAVFEGMNRAVFAEAFEDHAQSAFALCSAQSSFAFALSFFASEASGAGNTAAVLVMTTAVLTYPLFSIAQQFPSVSKKEDEHIAALDSKM